VARNNKKLFQFIRYLLVGGFSFLLEYGLFYVLWQIFSVHYLLANSIVYGSVSLINFLLNRTWTFNSSGQLKRQLFLYIALVVFNFFASNGLLYSLTGLLLIEPLISKVIVMCLLVSWNFVIYKKVIYK
jgi:putative flippase GtrA